MEGIAGEEVAASKRRRSKDSWGVVGEGAGQGGREDDGSDEAT